MKRPCLRNVADAVALVIGSIAKMQTTSEIDNRKSLSAGLDCSVDVFVGLVQPTPM
jgi:hypothetical protein